MWSDTPQIHWSDRYPLNDCPTRIDRQDQRRGTGFTQTGERKRPVQLRRKTDKIYYLRDIRLLLGIGKLDAKSLFHMANKKEYRWENGMTQKQYDKTLAYVDSLNKQGVINQANNLVQGQTNKPLQSTCSLCDA